MVLNALNLFLILASLRTRPTVDRTHKEVPLKKTRQVKTIEEDHVKTPIKAKVTRHNSVAVPKSKPTTFHSKRVKTTLSTNKLASNRSMTVYSLCIHID